MSQRLSLPCRIVSGALVLGEQTKKDLLEAVKRMKDGPVTLTIERKHATRSLNANAYYWGCVLELISQYNGDESADLHEFFKKRFNPKQILGDEIGGSTAGMNTTEFYEYVEKIRRFALMELGVTIPDPREY